MQFISVDLLAEFRHSSSAYIVLFRIYLSYYNPIHYKIQTHLKYLAICFHLESSYAYRRHRGYMIHHQYDGIKLNVEYRRSGLVTSSIYFNELS